MMDTDNTACRGFGMLSKEVYRAASRKGGLWLTVPGAFMIIHEMPLLAWLMY